MVAKDDKKTETLRLNFLENTAVYLKELRTKREAQLWKTVGIPNSLYDAIYGLTKFEMDKIRKNYDFKNLSALKKQDLAKTLSRLIPISFKQILYRLDQNRFDLIKMIMNHSGVLPDMGMKADNLEALRDFSLIFPVIDHQ